MRSTPHTVRGPRSTLPAALGLVGAIAAVTAPVHAQTITITAGGTSPTTINNLDPFNVTLTGGSFTGSFTNGTGVTLNDFEVTSPVQGAPLTGNGTTIFTFVPPGNNTSLTFLQGGTGTGVAPGGTFTVTASGFSPATGQLTLQASSAAPEPSPFVALSLGGLGLLGLCLRARRRASAA